MDIEITINQKLRTAKIFIESPSKKCSEKIVKKLNRADDPQVIGFKTKEGYHQVEIITIQGIEVFKDELEIRLTTGELIKTKGRLYQLKEDLKDEQFVQVSKSAIVNIREIFKLENSFSGNMTAHLRNNQRIAVSRRFLSSLKIALKHLSEETK